MKETTFQAAYLPVGAPTFHLPSAQDLFERSINALQALTAPGELQVPAEMLLSLDKLNAFLDTVTPDLLIVQGITFANGAYMSEILHRFPDVPVVLWTLREPVVGDGGRLRLNSLTGAYSAASPAVGIFFESQPMDLFLENSVGRGILISSSLIPEKATRSAAGVTLFSLKKGVTVTKAAAGEAIDMRFASKCRKNKIPATGIAITRGEQVSLDG